MATYRLRHNDLTKRLGKEMTLKIIIDTNFFLIPSKFRLDIFEELDKSLGPKVEPVLLSPTYFELQKLATSTSVKLSKQARLGLRLASRCKVVDVERKVGESNDDLLLRKAVEWGCPVATNDRELRGKLRSSGVSVVFLRQRSRLEVEGNV
jgi:rRNA-processing protein FCF1